MQMLAPEPNDAPKAPKTGEILVRPSTEADAPAMIAIYTRYVTHGLTGMAFEPMQADDIKRRRKNMQKHRLPHLVAELDGASSATPMPCPSAKGRPIAIASNTRSMCIRIILRAGVGRKLLPALIDACAAAAIAR